MSTTKIRFTISLIVVYCQIKYLLDLSLSKEDEKSEQWKHRVLLYDKRRRYLSVNVINILENNLES